MAKDILDYVPEGRIEDVIYFNPADKEFPVPFNPLEKVHPDYHHLVASGLISGLKQSFKTLVRRNRASAFCLFPKILKNFISLSCNDLRFLFLEKITIFRQKRASPAQL